MDARKIVTGVNWVLTLCGLRMFIKGRREKFLNYFFLVLYLLSVYHDCYWRGVDLLSGKGKPLAILVVTGQVVGTLHMHHRTFIQKRKIEEFIESTTRGLPKEYVLWIKKVSFVAMIVNLICVIEYETQVNVFLQQQKHLADNYARKLSLPPEEPYITISRIVLGLECLIRNVQGLSACLYLFVYYIRSVVIRSQAEETLRQIDRKTLFIAHEMKSLQYLNSVHETFEELFSYIPSQWLTIHMLSIAGYLSFFRQMGSGMDKVTRNTMMFSEWTEIMVMFGIFCFCDVQQKKIAKAYDTIVNRIQENHHSNQAIIFVTELRLMASKAVTASNIFEINKSLILTFMGSVLTFTVLLIQIEDDKNLAIFGGFSQMGNNTYPGYNFSYPVPPFPNYTFTYGYNQ